jgi:hypothetical protein
MKLTENELLNRLQKRKMHPDAMQEIMRVVAEQKHELRVERGKNHQHSRMWEELMTPLKYEIKLIKGLLKYPASEERRIALEAYLAVLDKLMGKMTLQQRSKDFTPYQIARAANKPNNGSHWTDWVGASKKLEVSALFDAIPYKAKAKKKLPFDRVIPKALWATLHERLKVRTEKELEQAHAQLRAADIGDDQDKRDTAQTKVSNITQALAWIGNMKQGEAVPVTWHGLF